MSQSKVIAIASGKGGVGKSFFSSNLGVLLADSCARTLLVDLDFGSANLHTYIGLKEAQYTLSDFLSNKIPHIKQIISPSPYKNLEMITGSQDDLEIQNVSEHLMQNLVTQLPNNYWASSLSRRCKRSSSSSVFAFKRSFSSLRLVISLS